MIGTIDGIVWEDGNLYITNRASLLTNGVLEYDAAGNFVRVFASDPSLGNPVGLVFCDPGMASAAHRLGRSSGMSSGWQPVSSWRPAGSISARPTPGRAVESMVASYRATMARFSEMTVLETWYAKIAEVEALKKFSIDPKALKLLLKSVDKATHNTSEHVFHKIVRVTDGKPRIADQPPLLSHGDPSEFTIEGDALPFFENYRATLSADRQALFDRFRLVDAANKVVGIGSVGTRCYIALFLGNQDDHLFLQVKEARPSVLEGLAGPSPCTNNGERVVTGQRLMQSASDIFLGWCRGTSGHDYYVRQLHDTKVAADLTGYTPRILTAYGRLCGRALARAHAKSGDAATIAGYLGANGVFDEAIAGYALAYADQVNKDYKSFRHAITVGRFPTETSRPASGVAGRAFDHDAPAIQRFFLGAAARPRTK